MRRVAPLWVVAMVLALFSAIRGDLAQQALAGSWPQILGPQRNGIAQGETLDAKWPKTGPVVRWQKNVGDGLAGVAVAGGRSVLFHRQGNRQVVEAMDAASGKVLWRTALPTRYVSTISRDAGPRCVPLIHKDAVYLFGAGGELFCLALDSGKQRWLRDTRREFKAPEGYFGVGSTPIVEDGKLLVNIGSRDGAGLVALGLADGKTIWKATNELASYSSPVAVTVGGARHVIFITRMNVVSLDPKNGDVRFKFPFGQRGPTVNGATPLVLNDRLFVTASYGIGAVLAKIGKDAARQVWQSDEVLSSQYPTAVQYKGNLYGIHGRQDAGVAQLRCIDPQQGKVLWSEKDYGMATFILAGDRMLSVKTSGELELIAPSAGRYRRLASARISNGTLRALPALANGLLYVRDEKVLKCLVVGRGAKVK